MHSEGTGLNRNLVVLETQTTNKPKLLWLVPFKNTSTLGNDVSAVPPQLCIRLYIKDQGRLVKKIKISSDWKREPRKMLHDQKCTQLFL